MSDSILLQPGAEPVRGYRLVRELGKGGFGEVWLAKTSASEVALRFVALDQFGWVLEERALGILRAFEHPNLLKTLGAWRKSGYLILAMELARGTLADRAPEFQQAGQPGIPLDELVGLLRDAAAGLDYLNAHTHTLDGKTKVGVQHCDIKPENIMLVGDRVKLGELGLARILEHSDGSHSNRVMSIPFAPPEVFQGQSSDHSDQYSLAVTFMVLRTGKLPFQGDSIQRLMMRIIQDPPDLSALPDDERPPVAHALAKGPKQRWASCLAFVEALAAVAASRKKADTLAEPKPGLEPIPGFKLVRMLGTGGFSQVWKAEQQVGSYSIALAFFSKKYAQHHDIIERLRSCSRLRHPHFLSNIGEWSFGGYSVFARELADGTLWDLLEDTKSKGLKGIPEPSLLVYMRAAASALDYMNAPNHTINGRENCGVMHGDVKPQNLFLIDRSLKIGDCALACILQNGIASHNGSMTVMYAAPELFSAHADVRSDQYSLAVTYVELQTGSLPFPADSISALVQAHLHESPNLSDLPKEERPIVARALEKEPDKRWPSCGDFVAALEKANAEATRRSKGKFLPGDEPIPGYQLVRLLGRGSVVRELWLAEHDGTLVSLQMMRCGDRFNPDQPDLKLLDGRMVHPHLARTKILRHEDHFLFVEKELIDQCLGEPDVALTRDDIVRYLWQAAEALDFLNLEQGIQHGDVHPNNLLCTGDALKLDCWCVGRILSAEPDPEDDSRIREWAPYCPTEQFSGKPSRHGDQFSLAACFVKLHTGQPPFIGDTVGELLVNCIHGKQSLDALSPLERPIVARALSKDPAQRWPSCRTFMAALIGGQQLSIDPNEMDCSYASQAKRDQGSKI